MGKTVRKRDIHGRNAFYRRVELGTSRRARSRRARKLLQQAPWKAERFDTTARP